MGLILDTDVLIRAEKVTDPIDFGKWSHHGEAFISAITCSELLVGVHLANTEARRLKRAAFVEGSAEFFPLPQVHPRGGSQGGGAAALTPSPLVGEGTGMGGMRQSNARKLRKHPTDAERLLWRGLRLRQLGGYKFRRQQPLGPYIVDFVCLEQRLCVEVDGGQHAEQAEEDARRTAWLEAEGFRVLRFWNTEVLQETVAVKEMIRAALDDGPLLNPPPQGGRK